MNANLSELLSVGLVAVAIGVTVLVLLVRRDLLPGPRGAGRVFLAGGLGLGIIAFAIKLAVASVIAGFPQRVVDPLIAEVGTTASPAGEIQPPAGSGGHVWQALPRVAPAPAGNPTTPAKVALGQRLFFDARLSRDSDVACASCHDLAGKAGADGRATAVGIAGAAGPRNTPTVLNAAFQARLFWDGRAASLEEQAVGPMVNPIEMGMPSLDAVVGRVAGDAAYRQAFADIWPGEGITIERVAQAIAAFERTLITPDTPYDRFVRGDVTALTARQQRGMYLFQTIGCVSCHSGANFSGASLIGPRSPLKPLRIDAADDPHGLTRDRGANGLWRVPSLRNVAHTGPYFHSGTVTDLAEAVRVMARSQFNAVIADSDQTVLRWSVADRSFEAATRLRLTEQDVADIVAFLHALSTE